MPIRYGDEYTSFIVDCYALDKKGRRLYDTAFFSRPKGTDKSGVAAAIVQLEAFGPCRFDGFAEGGETYEFLGETYTYQAGEPMGKPVHNPMIRIMATEEDQAGNTYDSVYYNLTTEDCPLYQLRAYGLDVGLTRVIIHTGGEIRPSTTGSASKDGGLETFTVFDEALALDTPLPTPSGWTTMRDVQVGDWLIGSDGAPTQVVKTTDVMEERQVYRVTFRDGTSVLASEGHLWEVRPNANVKPATRTTGEMYRDGRRFFVPPSMGVELPPVELPIDPYILGLWLGDGDKNNATISTCPADVDELVRNVEARGYTTRVNVAKSLVYVSLPGSHRNRFSPVKGLLVRLRETGLLGNKHIPAAYMRAGSQQRAELVRGLMDSDGHCSAQSGNVTFVTSDERMLGQVRELLRSLGQKPGLGFQDDERSRTGRMGRVWFMPRGGLVPFSFARKLARVNQSWRDAWDAIVSIERVESVPVKCVGVDADDHLFIAGEGWHVTHNTHLYTTKKLKEMYNTVSRNAVKRRKEGAWYIETTTMYAPGEESIAEETYQFAGQIQEGKARNKRLLFDHRYADVPSVHPMQITVDGVERSETEKEYLDRIEASFLEAFGDAIAWNDVAGLMESLFDPRNSVTATMRYFFNALVAASDAWIDPQDWKAAGLKKHLTDRLLLKLKPQWSGLRPGDKIALGFDGGRTDDATVLIACRISDGLVAPIGIWESPDTAEADGWSIDHQEVDAAVQKAHKKYKVVGFFADPPLWQDYVDKWTNLYGETYEVKASQSKPLEFYTAQHTRMIPALERVHTAILSGEFRHTDHPTLTRHVLNARRRERPQGTLIGKERKKSPKKIDAAIGMTLAVAARAAYLKDHKPDEPVSVPMRVR